MHSQPSAEVLLITKKSRLPRYQRVSDPPRMVITIRDREILESVGRFRLMTREQIERLHFPPTNGRDRLTRTSAVRQRLKLLYHHGYLERLPIPVSHGAWAWRPAYRLTKKGQELIGRKISLPDGDSGLFIEHQLKINDVMISFLLAAKANGYQIENWLDDAELKRQERRDYVTLRKSGGTGFKVAVIPDGYFALQLGNKRAHFFLELDQGTMSSQRWKTRVLAYKKYVETGKYQERYSTKSLRIIAVTTCRRRLESLKKATEEVGGGHLFWFTVFSDLSDRSVFSLPIWFTAGQPDGQPLITNKP